MNERTAEDVALTEGKRLAPPAEYARRTLASQLRIEDLLTELLKELRTPPESARPKGR